MEHYMLNTMEHDYLRQARARNTNDLSTKDKFTSVKIGFSLMQF